MERIEIVENGMKIILFETYVFHSGHVFSGEIYKNDELLFSTRHNKTLKKCKEEIKGIIDGKISEYNCQINILSTLKEKMENSNNE